MEGMAADRTLMPDFPGIAQAEKTENWDAGFAIDLQKIRPKDEQYWKQYRGTPKAFVTLNAGRRMWGNRFGDVTALRFAGARPRNNPFNKAWLRRWIRRRLALFFSRCANGRWPPAARRRILADSFLASASSSSPPPSFFWLFSSNSDWKSGRRKSASCWPWAGLRGWCAVCSFWKDSPSPCWAECWARRAAFFTRGGFCGGWPRCGGPPWPVRPCASTSPPGALAAGAAAGVIVSTYCHPPCLARPGRAARPRTAGTGP